MERFVGTWGELAPAGGDLRCHGADLVKPQVWFNIRSRAKSQDLPFTFSSHLVCCWSPPGEILIGIYLCVCAVCVCAVGPDVCLTLRSASHLLPPLCHCQAWRQLGRLHSHLCNTLIWAWLHLPQLSLESLVPHHIDPSADTLPRLWATLTNGPCSVAYLRANSSGGRVKITTVQKNTVFVCVI